MQVLEWRSCGTKAKKVLKAAKGEEVEVVVEVEVEEVIAAAGGGEEGKEEMGAVGRWSRGV